MRGPDCRGADGSRKAAGEWKGPVRIRKEPNGTAAEDRLVRQRTAPERSSSIGREQLSEEQIRKDAMALEGQQRIGLAQICVTDTGKERYGSKGQADRGSDRTSPEWRGSQGVDPCVLD